MNSKRGSRVLSRVDALQLPLDLSLKEIAEQQAADEQLQFICESSNFPLKLFKKI